jgi:chemotaxis protein MotB
MAQDRPILVIKKTDAHSGQHGGAWKVAYADFVTAVMALFIVFWLLNSNKKIQEAVGGYFRDPSGNSNNVGTDISSAEESLAVTKDDMPKLKHELERRIYQMSNFETLKNKIEMTVTPEGLRIELLEAESGTFFNLGSPKPNDNGQELFSLLAQELGKLPNQISIEGHTDSEPYAGNTEYSNWDLSTDRANAARRLMQRGGLRDNQVSQVRGYADQMLRNQHNPLDPSNRRISVIVRYVDKQILSENISPTSADPPAD